MFGAGGRYAGMGGGSFSARSGAARAWSFARGGGMRDTSPGFHSFAGSGSRAGFAGRSGGAGLAGRAGSRSMATTHAAMADGQWHSFAGLRPVSAGSAFVGGRGGFFGRGYGWGGWGYPGFGLGWGLGWGWGWGFGLGWDPFWYWPPYAYNPWWYGYPASYIYPYPY
jgi:hypothetical protein